LAVKDDMGGVIINQLVDQLDVWRPRQPVEMPLFGTVRKLRAAGEQGLPCRNEKLNVVLFKNAGLPELTMPNIFQESLEMIPAKAAKLERLIAESQVIDNMNMSKKKRLLDTKD
jgi:hypothetical protein